MATTRARKRRSPQHARAIEHAAEELRSAPHETVPRSGGRGWSGWRGGYRTARPVALGLAKLLLLPAVTAAPHALWGREAHSPLAHLHPLEETPKPATDPQLWIYLAIALSLVLGGGVFAGLTIALMGQDETYLQVLATSGEGSERENAKKVWNLLKRGKHWVLVTLLLANVITNETLPIVLDRSLGGGWPAVLSSTVLIVIFGEVAPQSVCVRYGLSIGARCAPAVLLFMWILAPISWPTAKLLDYLLGHEGGVTYKKAGLKTLVQLHKTLGTTPGERLMEDEVNIINSVLDLKEKSVSEVMTPMQDVFTMSADTILDERMMDTILSQGYSRIPIYAPDNNRNFIGMLLVKILITYDPEDAAMVRDFALATLPETDPHTSCLDIINFFQEGKSHMVLVSDEPGTDHGALGVVTLEDVIEELIGEEIVDESDVFIDIHKAIRRLTPADTKRYRMSKDNKLLEVEEGDGMVSESEREDAPLLESRKASQIQQTAGNGIGGTGAAVTATQASQGPGTTFMMRRKSSNASENPSVQTGTAGGLKPLALRSNTNSADLRPHLKHLGPSNLATKPRETKYKSVEIKPGIGTIPEGQATNGAGRQASSVSRSRSREPPTKIAEEGEEASENQPLLAANGAATGGVAAVKQAQYGTYDESTLAGGKERGYFDGEDGAGTSGMSAKEASRVAEENASPAAAQAKTSAKRSKDSLKVPEKMVVNYSGGDDGDVVGEMEAPSRNRSQNRKAARSGSITETTVDVGGVKKVVLETNSSSDQEDVSPTAAAPEASRSKASLLDGSGGASGSGTGDEGSGKGGNGDAGKKDKRKKRGKKKKGPW